MPVVTQTDRRAIRKLAHRYAMVVQRRVYEQMVDGLLIEAIRGVKTTLDSDDTRQAALVAAREAIANCPAEALAHT